MSGPDPRDATAVPGGHDRPRPRPPVISQALRIGYVADAQFPTDAHLRDLCDAAVRRLQELGAEVEDIEVNFGEARDQIEYPVAGRLCAAAAIHTRAGSSPR